MELTHRLQHWTKSKANKTLKWLPADSEKTFLERLKKDPNNPSLQHYIKHPIEYKMNNMGFRTPINFIEGIEGNGRVYNSVYSIAVLFLRKQTNLGIFQIN